MSWRISTSTGPAGPFHQLMPPDDTGPQLWIRHLPAPALVLGSTQPTGLIHADVAAADGIEVCRRRSGGGIVYIDPRSDCWIDVIVPRTSRLWDPDVGRAFHWLGRHWATVLADLRAPGLPLPVVHRSTTPSPAGRLWCFGQLGHGEVSIAGSKVLGLSQRRTRRWLRLQCLVLGSWPGAELGRYVDFDRLVAMSPDLAPGIDALDPGLVAAGFPAGTPPPAPSRLIERFLLDAPPP